MPNSEPEACNPAHSSQQLLAAIESTTSVPGLASGSGKSLGFLKGALLETLNEFGDAEQSHLALHSKSQDLISMEEQSSHIRFHCVEEKYIQFISGLNSIDQLTKRFERQRRRADLNGNVHSCTRQQE
jgi:hypothetical protein